jgi:hypothetical protein
MADDMPIGRWWNRTGQIAVQGSVWSPIWDNSRRLNGVA